MSDNAVVVPLTKKSAAEAPKGPPPKDLYELGENQDRLWSQYLDKLKAAGASRE